MEGELAEGAAVVSCMYVDSLHAPPREAERSAKLLERVGEVSCNCKEWDSARSNAGSKRKAKGAWDTVR
jgi:hypothetical protein